MVVAEDIKKEKKLKKIQKSGVKVLTRSWEMRYIDVHLRQSAASFLKGINQGWTAKARNACRRGGFVNGNYRQSDS